MKCSNRKSKAWDNRSTKKSKTSGQSGIYNWPSKKSRLTAQVENAELLKGPLVENIKSNSRHSKVVVVKPDQADRLFPSQCDLVPRPSHVSCAFPTKSQICLDFSGHARQTSGGLGSDLERIAHALSTGCVHVSRGRPPLFLHGRLYVDAYRRCPFVHDGGQRFLLGLREDEVLLRHWLGYVATSHL